MLNFSALAGGPNGLEEIIDPRQIFSSLNRNERFKFISSDQGDVLGQWHERRDQNDITIKMNTGSGKMLIGLLILKSSLNENRGPALYVAPDNYLVRQVIAESKALGISATDDVDDAEFRAGRAIAVINIDKIVNGKSVFGVGVPKIEVGAIVIDDAHACLDAISSQFTIELPRGHQTHDKLLALFEDDLKASSRVGWVEISAGDPHGLMQVPFWAWQAKIDKVLEILHAGSQSDELKWSWPLLKHTIALCRCAISGKRMEIKPRCIPIDKIPSFSGAKRKIYMTATLADDSVLITDLNARLDFVRNPIRPAGVGVIGDRMIVAPQEINPEIYEKDIKSLAISVSKKHNVVVLVPSGKRAEFWADAAAQVLRKENIGSGVDLLRSGHVGLSVLVNRYDGVDLPGNACRLLIIDGLPEFSGLLEQLDAAALADTEQQLRRQIQRIEQGMGRGVRSEEDRCAVIVFGDRLTERINTQAAKRIFTPATMAQIEMGKGVTQQIKGRPVEELRPILDMCMDRDNSPHGMEWWTAGRARLAKAKQADGSYIDQSVSNIRHAFDLAVNSQYDQATALLQVAVNEEATPALKGYLKQQLAEYTNFQSPAQAQTILLSASQENPRVQRPMQGVAYVKISSPALSQGQDSENFVRSQYIDTNTFLLSVAGLLSDLVWDGNRVEQFESAVQELGRLLGFGSQRPEKLHQNGGPDNLWAVGGLHYFVIECKNGVESPNKEVTKTYCNQLLGAVQWFKSHYSDDCTITPILIHPSRKFSADASASQEMRVIDAASLDSLKAAVKGFAQAVTQGGLFVDSNGFARELQHFKLNPQALLQAYSVNPK